MDEPNYIHQVGSCCEPIAVLNALRWYGFDTIGPDTTPDAWEDLVDSSGCRYGAAINTDRLVKMLPINVVPFLPTPDRLFLLEEPVVVSTWLPETGLHSCTVVPTRGVDVSPGGCVVVNLQCQGPDECLYEVVEGRYFVESILHPHNRGDGLPNFWRVALYPGVTAPNVWGQENEP